MIPFHLVAYGATKVDTNMIRSQKPKISEKSLTSWSSLPTVHATR